jgi:hypothetical protein
LSKERYCRAGVKRGKREMGRNTYKNVQVRGDCFVPRDLKTIDSH